MSTIQRVIKEAALVILAAIVLTAAAYAIRPQRITPVDAGMSSAGAALPGDGERVPAIDFADAVEHFTRGTAVFADARPEAAYRGGHIRGAVHFDPRQFESWSERVISQIDADAVIITYCDGERCALGVELAEKFTWLGYDRVFYLKDGWSRWKAAKMPAE